MSLKLIREAQLRNTTSPTELAVLVALKLGSLDEAADEKMELWTTNSGNFDAGHPDRYKSIGHYKTQGEARAALDTCPNKKMMDPIHKVAGYASWLKKKVMESFSPTADDYDAWMRVVVGEAQDRGVNLGKKSQFMQLVMDVLENDPASPPMDMQELIAGKLWQDYNSAKHEVKINNVVKAKEEEEKVEAARKQIASRHARGPATTATTNPSAYDEEESGFGQALKMAQGMEDEEDAMSFLRGAIESTGRRSVRKGSFMDHLAGEEDPNEELVDTLDTDGDSELEDDEVFTSTDDECECPCADEDMGDEDMGDEDMGDEDMGDEDMGDEDVSREKPKPEKFYDEEEAVKSFFRQAVTSPRSMMAQAVKDIEAEGKSAWRKSNVPANPHPQKSQAHKAWQKGMTAAAKETLGIADKPAAPRAKPKRKK